MYYGETDLFGFVVWHVVGFVAVAPTVLEVLFEEAAAQRSGRGPDDINNGRTTLRLLCKDDSLGLFRT